MPYFLVVQNILLKASCKYKVKIEFPRTVTAVMNYIIAACFTLKDVEVCSKVDSLVTFAIAEWRHFDDLIPSLTTNCRLCAKQLSLVGLC